METNTESYIVVERCIFCGLKTFDEECICIKCREAADTGGSDE